jgi:hypothetical protein
MKEPLLLGTTFAFGLDRRFHEVVYLFGNANRDEHLVWLDLLTYLEIFGRKCDIVNLSDCTKDR